MVVIVATLLLPQTVSFSIDGAAETGSLDPHAPGAAEGSGISSQEVVNSALSNPPDLRISSPVQIPPLASKALASLNAAEEAAARQHPIPDIIQSLAQAQLGNLGLGVRNSLDGKPPSSTPAGGSPNDKFFFAPSKTSTHATSSPLSLSPSQQASPLLAQTRMGKISLQPTSRANSPAQKNLTNPRRPVSTGPTVRPSEAIAKPRDATEESKRLSNDLKLFSDALWSIEPQFAGNGGLRNAIKVARTTGAIDKMQWVGTIGIPTDSLGDEKKEAIEQRLFEQYDSVPVYVDDSTFEGHYNHYCKQILWPTFHYQVPDDPKSKAYLDHSWTHYKKLNEKVAERIVEMYHPGDVVWVNDYHLLLVPELIRKSIPDAKIGFFLHVAFPSSEVFRCLAARRELLEGMLGANCVAFQIPEYSQHFLQTCNRILAVDVTSSGIRTEGKFVSVIDLAIGIDPTELLQQLESEEVQNWRVMIRERWDYSKKLIVARDKLDHIRGIKQKLLAYEEFLKKHPEWIENAVLIQVCLSTVSESELEGEVSKIVDRINSYRTNLASSQPVMFLQQDIDFQQYLALLQEADAFAVTSLREGMNLTCHEFVISNRAEVSGPLILSEFTGSASVLGKNAILANPWDRQQLSEAFNQALNMPIKERHQRASALRSYVNSNTSDQWVKAFVSYVEGAWDDNQKRMSNSLHRFDTERFSKLYRQVSGKKRVFFLNLDRLETSDNQGLPRMSSSLDLSSFSSVDSAVPGATGSKKANPYISPQRKISVLYELVSDPDNIVYVISADTRATLERLFRRVNNVGLIAENGAFLRKYGADQEWESYIDKETTKGWKKLVREMADTVAERLPGSWIETKESSIYFHVNTVMEEDPERASVIVGEFVNHVNVAFGSQQVRARLSGEKVVITSDEVGKVPAVQAAYDQCSGDVGLLFVAAEVQATEDDDRLFEWAQETGVRDEKVEVCTVALGSSGTLAEWVLEGVNGLLNTLFRVARGM